MRIIPALVFAAMALLVPGPGSAVGTDDGLSPTLLEIFRPCNTLETIKL